MLRKRIEVIALKGGECQRPDPLKLFKWTIRSFKIKIEKIEREHFNPNFSTEDEINQLISYKLISYKQTFINKLL